MDKEFWIELSKSKYEIPQGLTLAELTRELFSYLGSTDPQLRDDIGYTVFANWLKQERYSAEELHGRVQELLANLDSGIGETESDTVFLRTFSILFLAEIVHNDNKKTFLDKSEVKSILEKGLGYIAAEKDPRGYVPVKGWAHALAHTADLMLVLAKNRNIEESDLSKILNTISGKVFHSTQYVYIHGEDERLASAISEVFRRELISSQKVEVWAKSFVEQDWKGAYTDEERNRAYQNTRNLLRSIYLELDSMESLPRQGELKKIFFEPLNQLKPF
jgi:Protein of unknown function (DUF2785)